jgi:pyruvate/2-oxoglutarate dehydrogenase complex dihydrolipoamide dehydrogenase (E3) component
VAHSDRGIPVDDQLRTNIPHIYAAGDVLGGEQFSHVAGWQAFEATRNALLPGSASGRPNPALTPWPGSRSPIRRSRRSA